MNNKNKKKLYRVFYALNRDNKQTASAAQVILEELVLLTDYEARLVAGRLEHGRQIKAVAHWEVEPVAKISEDTYADLLALMRWDAVPVEDAPIPA